MARPDRRAACIAAWLCTVLLIVSSAPAASAQATPPVDGVIVDGFRPPAHIGAPGNRGWEYATAPGTQVRAALGGVVAFAGPVAGNLHVSIDHPAGLRTTYSFLADIGVTRGQVVGPGAVLGSTADTFHFGLRRNGAYVDPALLFAFAALGPPRLVPRPGRVPNRTEARDGAGGAWGTIPLHSLLGSNPNQSTFPPQATHGRRASGVGPGIR
ncbi:MAG: M23 family metallopeptidase [Actinomycetota bacterium]